MRMLPSGVTVFLLATSIAMSTVNTAFAQNTSAALRGPIAGAGDKDATTNNAVKTDSSELPDPASLGGPAPATLPGLNTVAPGLDVPASISPPPGSNEAHTNIGIPLSLPAATDSFLLNTTNPNAKPPKPPEPLKAVISNVEMTTGRREVALGNYRGLEVHVVNGTDRPLVFNGDSALLRFGNEAVRPITVRQVDQVANPQQTVKEQVIAVLRAGITIGTVPAIKDALMQHGPILKRYGADEQRREDEQSRFGKRILWPGDTSDGIVFFQTDRSLHGGTLELPVCSLSDLQDRTSLSGITQASGTVPLQPITEGEAAGQRDLPPLPGVGVTPKGRKKEHPRQTSD